MNRAEDLGAGLAVVGGRGGEGERVLRRRLLADQAVIVIGMAPAVPESRCVVPRCDHPDVSARTRLCPVHESLIVRWDRWIWGEGPFESFDRWRRTLDRQPARRRR